MMDRCEKIVEQASDYLDKNMSFSKRMKMRLHLLMCVHCRNFVRQFELTIGAIQGMGNNSPRSGKESISDEEIENQVKKLLKMRE